MKVSPNFIILLLICSSVINGFGQVNPSINGKVGKIVFVGDSNTNNDEWQNGSYVDKLPERGSPWNETDIINSGIDGAGAYLYYKNAEFAQNQIYSNNPNIIFINLGGNDFLFFENADTFKSHYTWLMEYIVNDRGYQNVKKVFLMNIIWSPRENTIKQESREIYFDYQQIIANASEKYDFGFIDVYNATYQNYEFFQDDQIHLNEQGHQTVAELVYNETSSIISEELQNLTSTSLETGSTSVHDTNEKTSSNTNLTEIHSDNTTDEAYFFTISQIFVIFILFILRSGRKTS